MVADHCLERGISVGKFIPVVEYPLPNKPFDIDTNKEARQSYKRECAEVYNKRADSFRRSCRTRMTMEAVNYSGTRMSSLFRGHLTTEEELILSLPFLHLKIQTLEKVLLKFAKEA